MVQLSHYCNWSASFWNGLMNARFTIAGGMPFTTTPTTVLLEPMRLITLSNVVKPLSLTRTSIPRLLLSTIFRRFGMYPKMFLILLTWLKEISISLFITVVRKYHLSLKLFFSCFNISSWVVGVFFLLSSMFIPEFVEGEKQDRRDPKLISLLSFYATSIQPHFCDLFLVQVASTCLSYDLFCGNSRKRNKLRHPQPSGSSKVEVQNWHFYWFPFTCSLQRSYISIFLNEIKRYSHPAAISTIDLRRL